MVFMSIDESEIRSYGFENFWDLNPRSQDSQRGANNLIGATLAILFESSFEIFLKYFEKIIKIYNEFKKFTL